MNDTRRYDYSAYVIRRKGKEEYIADNTANTVDDKLRARIYNTKDQAIQDIASFAVEKVAKLSGGTVRLLTEHDIEWELVSVNVRYVFGSSQQVNEECCHTINEIIRDMRAKFAAEGQSNLDKAAEDKSGYA